jgi:hypothetical protein
LVLFGAQDRHSSCVVDPVAGDGAPWCRRVVESGGCERLESEKTSLGDAVQVGAGLTGGSFCGLEQHEATEVECTLSRTACGRGRRTQSGLVVDKELCLPPLALIGRVIELIRSQRACSVLVVPVWVGQMWWPVLRRLAPDPEDWLPLGPGQMIFTLGRSGQGAPLRHNWQFVAVRLFGGSTSRDFEFV